MIPPTSPIPSIEISFAPPEEIFEEPYSPFKDISFPSFSEDVDSPRSSHLLPPPASSPFRNPTSPQNPSPLGRTVPAHISGKGLDRDHFESMLRATRERASRKAGVDLRKEITLKAHKNKQAERRALFLSKIEAPPSPSATQIPVTPPDSPAVLHYSLPSPGLVSPISLFEALAEQHHAGGRRGSWVETVDFQSVSAEWEQKKARKEAILRPRGQQPALKSMPSLDQISARISAQPTAARKVRPVAQQLPIGPTARAPIPLPAFLRTRTPSQPPVSPAAPARLPLPELPAHVRPRAPTPPPPPHPKFNVSTTVVEHPAPPAPVQLQPSAAGDLAAGTPLTQANLTLLESRNEKGKAMLEKILRRVSSPAEMERAGRRRGEVFGEHRIFNLPGGF